VHAVAYLCARRFRSSSRSWAFRRPRASTGLDAEDCVSPCKSTASACTLLPLPRVAFSASASSASWSRSSATKRSSRRSMRSYSLSSSSSSRSSSAASRRWTARACARVVGRWCRHAQACAGAGAGRHAVEPWSAGSRLGAACAGHMDVRSRSDLADNLGHRSALRDEVGRPRPVMVDLQAFAVRHLRSSGLWCAASPGFLL